MCLTFLTEGSSSLDLHHYRHILRASINVEPGVTLIFWQSRLKMPFKELLLYVQYIHQQNQHIFHVITEPAGFSYLLSDWSPFCRLSNLIFRDSLTDLIKEKYAPGKIYNKTNCFFSPKFIKINLHKYKRITCSLLKNQVQRDLLGPDMLCGPLLDFDSFEPDVIDIIYIIYIII